nr:hypothetical protein [Tanacetum cinerariifolium]
MGTSTQRCYGSLNPKMLSEPLPKDVVGPSTQRCCRSLYPKIWWEPLPKDVMGASTQRCGGSLYPKMLWEPQPKDVMDASWEMELVDVSYLLWLKMGQEQGPSLHLVGTKFTWSGGQGFYLESKVVMEVVGC